MKKKVIGIVALIVVVVALVIAWAVFREKPMEGSKSISIEVIDNEGESELYLLKTDAKYLEEAMNQAKAIGLTFEGYEGPYGFTVETVNGVKASFDEGGAYWGFYVNDGYCNYGISEQPVEDGDAFVIKYEMQ